MTATCHLETSPILVRRAVSRLVDKREHEITERRLDERRPAHRIVQIGNLGESSNPMQAVCTDISLEGMRLIHRQKLPSEELSATVPSESGGGVEFLGTAEWTREEADGWLTSGVRLLSLIHI